MDVRGYVVATGGSVVYSRPAMEKLKRAGPVVLLDLPPEQLERRIADLHIRGVVMPRGTTLRELYEQRIALYRDWADVEIDCQGRIQDQVVAEILRRLSAPERG